MKGQKASRGSQHRPPARRGPGSLKRLVVLALGVVVLAILAFLAFDVYLAVEDLRRGVARLEQASVAIDTTPSAWTPGRLEDSRRLQREGNQEITRASSRLHASSLLRASLVVPGLKDQTRSLLDLAAASEDASAATADLLQVIDDYQKAGAATGLPGTRLIDVLSKSVPASSDAEQHLDRAIRRLDGDLDRPLLPTLEKEVRAAMSRLRPARDRMLFLAATSTYLPPGLGKGSPKTYLLLFENPSEIRPAGGFVGVFGTITVTEGRPGTLDVRGEEELDHLYRNRFPIPRSIGERLTFPNNSLDIGDAGWDADFPSSARLSEQMYQSATGRAVDGTIALDPYAIQALLKVTGPIDVPPYGVFDEGNFFSKINLIVNVDKDPDSGKKALGPVSRSILQRMLGAPVETWLSAITVSREQAQSRHIQFFLHDPSLASATHAARFDGSVIATADEADYLMVVDANVGGTKGDFYVRKQMQGKVEVSPRGFARHEVIVRYDFPAGVTDPAVPKGHDPAYRDYVRFYLPETSRVLDYYQAGEGAGRQGAIEEVSIEHGKRVVGAFFRLVPGQSTELHILFDTPTPAVDRYRLYVQKQAGVPARSLDLLISYPGGQLRRQLAGERDEEAMVSW